MKIGLTSYSLNADIMSGRKTILDAMRFAAENGAEHMEIVPFGFTLYDDGRDEFNQPLIDSIRQTAEALLEEHIPFTKNRKRIPFFKREDYKGADKVWVITINPRRYGQARRVIDRMDRVYKERLVLSNY